MRRNLIALSAVTLLCLLVGCSSDMPTYSLFSQKKTARPAASGSEIRVMSFNLRTKVFIDAHNHWNHRKDLVVQTINRFGPDLLGTQECQISQARFLKSHLPGYQFVGAGRDDGKADGEMCGIFFRGDKFTKLDEGHFWLSENPYEAGSKSWGSGFRRMVSWVKLQPRDRRSQPFYFFNTHFDNTAARARVQQAWLLRRMIDRIADGAPTIVTGDFNTDSDNTPPYQLLVSGPQDWRGYLVDTYRQVNPVPGADEGTRHGFHGGVHGDRIDWIITTNNFSTVSAAIDRTSYNGQYPSDHFPVTAVVRMRGGSQFAGHRSAYVGGS